VIYFTFSLETLSRLQTNNKNLYSITFGLGVIIMVTSTLLSAAASVAIISLALQTPGLAGGEWPDGPNKAWFQGLQRPDNHQNPQRDYKSRFCCDVADTVKTTFRVEPGTEKYPEDRWYAWIKDEWIPIPPEKIVNEYAPDGRAYLFMLAGTVQCFVPPKGDI
jgi:hypothetical protein